MRYRFIFCVLSMVMQASFACCGELWREDWNDGQANNRWSGPIEVVEGAGLSFDGLVDQAFDYSSWGVPSAPGSTEGSTVGLRLEANRTDQTPGDEGESVGLVPLNFDLPEGDYLVEVDLYLFTNTSDSGSTPTEYATLGAHHQRSPQVPLRFGNNAGDGIAWQLDSDGGSAADLIRYSAPATGNASETSLGGWESMPDGTIPQVPTGSAPRVGLANQWVRLGLVRRGTLLRLEINGATVDEVNASSFDGGTLLLGHSDPFSSVGSTDSMGRSNASIFDNLVVRSLIAGDYNRDGLVDAADYTVWRDSEGSSTLLAADGNGDGQVTQADWVLWRDHYGTTSQGLTQAVPEPATGCFVLLLFVQQLGITLRLRKA